MDQDPYELLQVSPNASLGVIEAAYRRLAKTYHPDNVATGDSDRFKSIQAAYELLRDPAARAQFDLGRGPRQKTPPRAEASGSSSTSAGGQGDRGGEQKRQGDETARKTSGATGDHSTREARPSPRRVERAALAKNQPLLILGAGLVLLAMAVVVIFLLSGNNDGDPDVSKTVNGNKGPASTGGTLGGPEPIAQLPASKYIPLITEVPGENEVNVSDTFTMNITTFTSSYWFINDQEGQDRAREWKIVDGYQVYYQPVGLSAQVLQGDFFTTIETYLFADVEGAKGAYTHLAKKIGLLAGTEVEKPRGLANESSAYSLVQGTVGVSDVAAVYHRFIFRRGNAVVSVQTYGGEPFMTIDEARELAVMIDDKLLGQRPATEPTPIPTPAIIGVDAD